MNSQSVRTLHPRNKPMLPPSSPEEKPADIKFVTSKTTLSIADFAGNTFKLSN